MARRVEITPGALIGGAALLLILPLRWLAGAALAAAVHELWHYGAILLCGGEVYGLRISGRGAGMLTGCLTPHRELICAAAGPLGSFSLLLFARFLPVTALCGLIQGSYNLLPLFPMDGGRMLRCGLEVVFPRMDPERLHRVEKAVETGIICILVCILARLKLWLWVVLFLALAASKYLSEKNTLQRWETKGTIEVH